VAASLSFGILVQTAGPAAGAAFAPAVAAGVALLAGTVAATILSRLRGGLDGDGCGAVIELSLAAGLLAASLLA
jgi:cobalamin synthase